MQVAAAQRSGFSFLPDGHDVLLREGSKPHSRDAPRLGSREPGPALAGRTNGKEDPGLEALEISPGAFVGAT